MHACMHAPASCNCQQQPAYRELWAALHIIIPNRHTFDIPPIHSPGNAMYVYIYIHIYLNPHIHTYIHSYMNTLMSQLACPLTLDTPASQHCGPSPRKIRAIRASLRTKKAKMAETGGLKRH
ncbi:hypothetical protein DM02DRAFT_240192 [Periconia macrospinosa]|uniref:Uncharacterized protein n=1 Tax=Periconia macrospinosa TaxID=97972 RepID=A0A2V1DZF7_9PLEO|nr:hypothetical protein DM02DRAFT_240192 [Periconia macrospinosa]